MLCGAMPDTFRRRYPPPWRIEEAWNAVEIYDSRGVKLLTIPAVESVPKKPRWFQISMSRAHAMVLAKAICRLAKTGT